MISIKSALFGLAAVTIASVASVATDVSVASAETMLRYTDGGPNRGTRAAAQNFFAKEVERLSGGDLKIEIHWGGALLKWKAALGGIGAGTADMGAVLAAYAPNQLKALAIGDLPLNNSDAWVGMRAMYELMTTNKELQASLAKQNVVYIGNFTTTAVQFECAGDHKINTVADIKGKKMRASGVYAKVLNDLGANMVSMTYGKVYQALDSGLIECSAGYFYANRAYKLYEVVNRITRVDWGQISGFAIAVNKDVWGDLSAKQQQVLLEAGSNMTDHFAKLQIDGIESTVAGMTSGKIGRKVEVVTMAEEERQKLFAAAQPYVNNWVGDMKKAGFNGQQIWDQFQSLIAKYTKERDAKGYPWVR